MESLVAISCHRTLMVWAYPVAWANSEAMLRLSWTSVERMLSGHFAGSRTWGEDEAGAGG